MMHTCELFSYESEPLNNPASVKAARLRERLKSAGITWEESVKSGDCERSIPDSDDPYGWSLSFGSYRLVSILVPEADIVRARTILAELF